MSGFLLPFAGALITAGPAWVTGKLALDLVWARCWPEALGTAAAATLLCGISGWLAGAAMAHLSRAF